MKPKLKPELDLESVQSDLIETVCYKYTNGTSVRALAKQMEMSPMKVRKILITGGAYSTDLSTEIDALYKEGKHRSPFSLPVRDYARTAPSSCLYPPKYTSPPGLSPRNDT